MRSGLRAAAWVALNRPRVVGLVLAVVVAETALRLALSVAEPLAAVLCPPVIAIPLLGAAAPAVRAAVRDPATAPDWRLAARLRAVGPRLLAAAVFGHVAAVAFGAALFILIDTPVRFTVYALGGSVPPVLVFLTPLIGVAVGTLFAWAALAPGLACVAAGNSFRDAARAAAGTAITDPRRTATLVAVGLAGTVVVGLAGFTGLVLTARIRSLLVPFVGGGGLSALAGIVVAPFCYAAVVAIVDGSMGAMGADGGRSSASRIPVRRAVVACLLVLALFTGACAVRVTETRLTPNETTPLPSDPTAAYATAVSNTAASNNRIEYRAPDSDGNMLTAVSVLDRTDRRFWISIATSGESGNITGYADAGVEYYIGSGDSPFALGTRRIGRHVALAFPGYRARLQYYDPTGWPGVPKPNTGTWTVVSRGNGTETLELDGAAAYLAVSGAKVPTNATYHTAWVRMRVDTERGVLLGGRARVNATLHNWGTKYDTSVRYDVKTGPDVVARRPAALGPRMPGEWLWKLFAY